jgi:hypothetical protein
MTVPTMSGVLVRMCVNRRRMTRHIRVPCRLRQSRVLLVRASWRCKGISVGKHDIIRIMSNVYITDSQ